MIKKKKRKPDKKKKNLAEFISSKCPLEGDICFTIIWPASGEICMQVRKQQLELDMEQQTGSK